MLAHIFKNRIIDHEIKNKGDGCITLWMYLMPLYT